MNISKFLFLWLLIITILMALSSSSLMALWLCLEINMMSFIPLMNYKNMISTEGLTLYFIVQALASSIFIFSISFFLLNWIFLKKLTFLMTSSMLIKLGTAPFHFWFPQISEGLSFTTFFILTTIQKFIPLHILTFMNANTLPIFILLSATIGSLGGFSQFSVRKILAFSSIAHLSWMLSLIYTESNLWLIYLIVYMSLIGSILIFISMTSINFINQVNPNSFNMYNMSLIISFLSLGGMPPFLGFFMKWMTMKVLMIHALILLTPLILSSLINLYFYTRILYPLVLKLYSTNKNTLSLNSPLMMMLTFQSSMIFLMIPLI
uniref:NADH dehydrogenase subunit 2 n=1 Tax=Ornithodoros tartakovskyi TaxID=570969 RepID=UPI00223776ED|nr:NADH dehydrogenase subunit 2 [Ornithodoros tartakovskyi]UYB78665.1 NADH dehydrogenase subunit 2 [Ornithodoros tartakovskyi]UYB78678.1 NADH dehydrogenase subunit 2 [Ornithodoros tartakovskyi]